MTSKKDQDLKMLHTAFRCQSGMHWLASAHCEYRFYSVGLSIYLGSSPQRSEPCLDLHVHPDDEQRRKLALSECLRTGEPLNVVYRLSNNKGEYNWISEEGSPLVGAGGEQLGIYATCQVVSPQSQEHASVSSGANVSL